MEARDNCPRVPILLVGLKVDLREDKLAQVEMKEMGLDFTTIEQGENAVSTIGASEYVELSALTGDGVDDVFSKVTLLALSPPLRQSKGRRSILPLAQSEEGRPLLPSWRSTKKAIHFVAAPKGIERMLAKCVGNGTSLRFRSPRIPQGWRRRSLFARSSKIFEEGLGTFWGR